MVLNELPQYRLRNNETLHDFLYDYGSGGQETLQDIQPKVYYSRVPCTYGGDFIRPCLERFVFIRLYI